MTKVQNQLHVPVMLTEVLGSFLPVLEASDGSSLRYFDGTLGRGGHLRAVLESNPQLSAVAMDQDPEAIEHAQTQMKEFIAQGRLILVKDNFANFKKHNFEKFDMMLLDLGVSSPQLDQGQRGFSFYHQGPLDMRMDPDQGLTAAEIINTASEDELVQLFKTLGEIHKPYRVVRAIVNDRKAQPFVTTSDLSGLIERVDGWHRKGFHPATQYFMALRLRVNQELEVLEKAIPDLILGLKPRGRLAVLTFHSLEDRIVKNVFKERTDLGSAVNKKVIQPQWNEAKQNPRARSAKLRIFERGMDASAVEFKV